MVRLGRAYPATRFIHPRIIIPAGPPTFDAIAASPASQTNTNWSHTVGAAGAYGLVFIAYTAGVTFTSVTFGSTNLTQLGTIADGTGYASYVWGANGLAAGTQNVKVNYSSTAGIFANSVSVKGVTSAATPVTKVFTGSGSHSVTATANQLIVQSFEDMNTGVLNGLTGGTLRWVFPAQPNGTMSISTSTSTTSFATTDANTWASNAVVLS